MPYDGRDHCIQMRRGDIGAAIARDPAYRPHHPERCYRSCELARGRPAKFPVRMRDAASLRRERPRLDKHHASALGVAGRSAVSSADPHRAPHGARRSQAPPRTPPMIPTTRHVTFSGRLIIVGFGSIGQGVLPLILRHVEMTPQQITIITAEERGAAVAHEYGIRFVEVPLTRENYRTVLEPLLGPGDFLLNVSVEVASVALIELCQAKGALYLDTCIEPWPGGYTDPSLSPSQRSNYALRESALALGRGQGEAPTALLTHGANPGLVSHLVKQALLDIAAEVGAGGGKPGSRAEWAALAARLGIKVIHIAERDTQVSPFPKERGEFVNTWSIEGFVGEGAQPAELGWGTHERHF